MGRSNYGLASLPKEEEFGGRPKTYWLYMYMSG
jgi:hypothetical protein